MKKQLQQDFITALFELQIELFMCTCRFAVLKEFDFV